MNPSHKTMVFIILMATNLSFAMYDTQMGRFMQQDPLGIQPAADTKINPFRPPKQYTDDLNTFEYVLSNPFNYIDSLGLERVIAVLNGQNMMGLTGHSMKEAFGNAAWVNDPENIVRFFEEDSDWFRWAARWIKRKALCSRPGRCCNRIIITGHSNGGDGAIKVAAQLRLYPVDLLFLFDPVPKPWRRCHPDKGGPLRVSNNVRRGVSIVQRSDPRRLLGYTYMQGWRIDPGINWIWTPPYPHPEGPDPNPPHYYAHTAMLYDPENQAWLQDEIDHIPAN